MAFDWGATDTATPAPAPVAGGAPQAFSWGGGVAPTVSAPATPSSSGGTPIPTPLSVATTPPPPDTSSLFSKFTGFLGSTAGKVSNAISSMTTAPDQKTLGTDPLTNMMRFIPSELARAIPGVAQLQDDTTTQVGLTKMGAGDILPIAGNAAKMTAQGLAGTPVRIAATVSDALDQTQGLPPSASWNIPGLGTVNSMQMNIIKRVQNGENPLTVGLGEASNTLFDTLFLVGIADTVAGPRQVKVLETKGTLPEGSPQVAPPKTGRLYQTPSATTGARVLTPQELTQMQSQGIKMPANFNPAQPVFFRTTLGKGGTYTGEMYQIKPSYLHTAYDSVFGTKTATKPSTTLPALLGAEPSIPQTALMAPEMNARITTAPTNVVTTLHSQTTSESAIVKATNDAVAKNPTPTAPVVPVTPIPPSTALTVSHNAIRLLGGDTAHATKGVAILEKNIQDGVTIHGPEATAGALVKQLGVDQKTAATLVRETLQKTPVDPHALLAKITGQSVAPPTGPISGKMEKGDTIALTHIKSGEVTHAIYQGPGNAGLNTASSHTPGGVMALEPKSGIPMRYPSDRFSVKLVKKGVIEKKSVPKKVVKPKVEAAEKKIKGKSKSPAPKQIFPVTEMGLTKEATNLFDGTKGLDAAVRQPVIDLRELGLKTTESSGGHDAVSLPDISYIGFANLTPEQIKIAEGLGFTHFNGDSPVMINEKIGNGDVPMHPVKINGQDSLAFNQVGMTEAQVTEKWNKLVKAFQKPQGEAATKLPFKPISRDEQIARNLATEKRIDTEKSATTQKIVTEKTEEGGNFVLQTIKDGKVISKQNFSTRAEAESEMTPVEESKPQGGEPGFDGVVKEWGTQNQYYQKDPYRKQLDEMTKTGNFDTKILQKSARWEMGQVLEDKPAYLSNRVLSPAEMQRFAEDNGLVYGTTIEDNTPIVAKDERVLEEVRNATNQRELGLALGYKDLKAPDSRGLTLRSEEPIKERTQGPGNTQVNVTEINGERVEAPTPLISKTDLKNLINTFPNQEGDFKVAMNTDGQMRMNLTTPNGEMSLRPSALGLVESQLREGDVIHIDSDNLKAKGTSFRVVNKDNKVEASGGGADSGVRMVKPNFASEKISPQDYSSAEEFVKAQGTPVYHGTLENFSTFDSTKAGSNTQWDNAKFGHFFLDDAQKAKEFPDLARMPGDTRPVNVKEAYISLNNPLDLTTHGIFTNEAQAPFIVKLLGGEKMTPKAALEYLNENIGLGEMGDLHDGLYGDIKNKALMQKAGYDGVVSDYGDGITEKMVFDSSQIKTKSQLTDIWNKAHANNPNRGFVSVGPAVEAAEKMSKFIEETGKKIEVSENLADDLYKLETNNKRDLEIAIQMLTSIDFSPADAETVYHYEEDKTLPLTEKQQELYDTVIKPLAEKSSEIFSRLQNEGLPMNNEDYTPRFVKGKKSAVERIARALIDGVKNVSAGQGSMLSKTTGAMKKRTMKALVDENGNRTVVSIKGGKVMSIQGKVAVHMGNLARRVAPKVKEFFDPEVRGKLEQLAKDLGITHERHATGRTAGLGGKRAGVSFQGESLIKTRMSPDSVLAHEIGHQIDHKYGMQQYMAEERYDKEHRLTLAREMRALADERFAGEDTKPGFKAYVRKGSEKMAVMFEAYISNKQLFKDVAPHLYDDFRQFLRDHKELAPFLDIKGSVTLDSTVHGGNLLAGRSGNTFVSNTGKHYTIEDATTKEIERDTSVQYHKNVLVNRTLQYLKLRQIDRANEFIEAFKNDPNFSEIAVKTGEEAPAHFKGTRLPQFRGYLLEPRLAEIFNRLADKMDSPDGMYAAMGTLNRVLRNAIFFNPLIHVPNITVHWLVNRGLSKFALPMGYIRGAKAFARAWDAVVHHSDDYLVALEHGAPLLSSDASNKKLAEVLLNKMATDLQSNPDLHSKIATALGYANPANLIKAIYKFSSTVTWGVNDLLTMQAVYEDMATHGWSLDRAIEETGKHIPNYRVPERIFDKALTTVAGEKVGGAMAQTAGAAMKNPVVSMFGAYHYGALRSYGEMMDSLMTGNKAGGKEGWKNRAGAADKIAMMGLLGLVLYPYLLDKFARWLTGNKNAQFRRAGSLTFPENISQLLSGEKDAGQVFQSVITPAPATKMIVELFPNIDFWSGSKIYGIGGEGFWNFMADQIAPLQQARQVTTGTKSAVSFFASLGGISSPTSTGSEKILQMMIYDEKPKLLKDMKARIAAGDVQGAKDIGHEFNIRLANTIKESLLDNGKSGSDAQVAAVLNINGLRMPGTVAMANYTGNKGKSFIAKLSADGKPTIKTGVAIQNDSLIHAVMVYASAIVTDPASAMSDIFQGQIIQKVDNGTVIVRRMSVTDSQAIKADLGGGKIPAGMTLDHTIPLELGGTNNESNLKLVPSAEAKAADAVENYLGNALTAGSIDKATAQKLMLNYKSGIMTFDDVKNAIAK